ncbi:MAG TPA: hypothetical protein VHW09_24090 [Bryobacteraceae bacterium]|jgi:hypothetical protein|nr:hypothetical protein [Bryobacteraceae bacterium]
MDMSELIVRSGVPALSSQHASKGAIAYVRLVSPGSSWECYISEASMTTDGLVIYGYFIADTRFWYQMTLTKLVRLLAESGLSIVVDDAFTPLSVSDALNIRRPHAA